MSERSDLRDGIIGYFVYMLLFIFSFLGTPLSFISMSILPLPVLVYTAKHTRKAGLVLSLALIVSSAVFDLLLAVVTLMCAGAGWGMGQFHHRQRYSIKGLLLTGSLTFVAGFFVLFALISAVSDISFVQELEQQWTNSVAIYQDIWGQLGLELSEDELQNAHALMMSLLPFAFLMMAGSLALLNHGLGRLILHRLQVPTVKLPPFREWHFPRSLLAWYIISIMVSFFSRPGSYWYSAGMTGTWLIQVLFVVQALAFLTAAVTHFVRVKTMWLILLAVLFFPIIIIGFLFLYFPLSFLGMLDIGFRFRDKFKHASRNRQR